ncbi:MAG TPA: GFA family protein [Candidatus Saccharimonadales bacterium]|nr:GFA family protein [Candidatus Saccharimonadales bacterium]
MSERFDGGCFCKAVRYRLSSGPMFVHCCHCLNCQSQTGSAFVINAIIETDRIELLSGELVVSALESGDGSPHDIYRCSRCLCAVWSDYGRRPGWRFVRVGTLDDPAALSPDVHIFTRSKQPWVTLPEGVPAFDVFYDRKALWPAESLQRRRAAMGRPASSSDPSA